ncbi:Extradiol ring-cleavage dioxygenase, class III enzyme, subunit B [Leptodontidium sp. MPI-SDFR-AT-0119]|nr:Extradiol ring-cleavage dioxygenase, class III enzyme, subunit B [Leptodontidium sp. MPI-SDFR-AT-0119]
MLFSVPSHLLYEQKSMSAIMARAASIAICHGGGPLPLMGDPGSAEIAKSLRTKVPELLRLGTPNKPRAIVIVTAHWSERKPTISNGQKNDFAPGSPEVAQEVFDALQSAAMEPVMDSKRGYLTYGLYLGWDHGVFVPMLLINPSADVPIVQLSVLDSESPRELYKNGCSGAASFHNIGLFMKGGVHDKKFRPRNIEWSKALSKVVQQEDPAERQKGLEQWRDLPGAKDMHPEHGVEHFLPLIVCAGAGGNGKAQKYGDEMMGAEMFTYYWT